MPAIHGGTASIGASNHEQSSIQRGTRSVTGGDCPSRLSTSLSQDDSASARAVLMPARADRANELDRRVGHRHRHVTLVGTGRLALRYVHLAAYEDVVRPARHRAGGNTLGSSARAVGAVAEERGRERDRRTGPGKVVGRRTDVKLRPREAGHGKLAGLPCRHGRESRARRQSARLSQRNGSLTLRDIAEVEAVVVRDRDARDYLEIDRSDVTVGDALGKGYTRKCDECENR